MDSGIEVKEGHGEVPCTVCGEPATRYEVMPICDNVVCYQVRYDTVLEEVKKLKNKNTEGDDFEVNQF